MRILLMDTPYAVFTGYFERYFCPGMASIAAVLSQEGHEVAVFEADTLRQTDDLDFTSEYKRLEAYLDGLNNPSHWIWKEIWRVLEDFRPDLVGITSVTMKFGSAVRVAELCKEYNPGVKVILGGPHATDWPEMSLRCAAIDFNQAGEAEESVVELIRAIEAGTETYNDIPGLSYRKDGGIVHNLPLVPPRDLDRFPFPARDLLMNQDRYTSEDMGLILTSRGCPYHCTFCSHERLVRYRSIDNIIEEIKLCIDRYGTTQFCFKDDSFTVNRKRTIEFCKRLVEQGLDINWECTTRVNLLDEELLDIMLEAGLNVVKVGIETGSEWILRQIEKTANFDQMRQAAELFNRKGIFWTGYFMYGLPTETKEDMVKTYAFMKELNPYYAGLGLYAPYPNTPLWDVGVEMDLLDPHVDIDHFFTINPKDYFFKDPSRRVATMEPDEFREMAEWMTEAFHRHNTQLGNLLRRGWTRRKTYRRDFGLLASDIRKVLTWLGLPCKVGNGRRPKYA